MKKDLFKKLRAAMSVLVVGLVTTCVMINAKADTPAETHKITVENFAMGSTYTGYKIFDAVPTVVDEETRVVYSIKANSPWFSVVDDADDVFNLVLLSGTAGSADAVYQVVVEDNADVVAWVKSISIPATATATLATIDTEDEDFDGTVMWPEVTPGYYYITTGPGTIITVDNSLDDDIIVIDKNRTPDWDPEDPENPDSENPDDGKFVKENSTGKWGKGNDASIGETVEFMINAFAPKYNRDQKILTYTFTDTLPVGLTYDAESFKMYILGMTDAVPAGKYAVDVDEEEGQPTVLTITYTISAITGYPTDAHVSFTYEATLNTEAIADNKNTVSMEWTEFDPDQPDTPRESDDEDEPGDSETDTLTYGFSILKTNEDGDVLEDAEFELYCLKVVDGVENRTQVKFSVVGDTYTCNPEGSVGTIVTDEDGVATIFGLDDDDNISYVLKETKAPDGGYNKIAGDIEVVLEEVNTIVNKVGALLPSTGGIGTTIFYVVGGLLVVGAGVLLITKKRMEDAE